MTASLIDGNALAKQIRAQVSGRTQALRAAGVIPRLAILMVGDDPASAVYTRHKVNDSTETGLDASLERFAADMPEADLLARVRALNEDASVHGILVQLPLPKHMDGHKVIAAISPAKDVDGSASDTSHERACMIAFASLFPPRWASQGSCSREDARTDTPTRASTRAAKRRMPETAWVLREAPPDKMQARRNPRRDFLRTRAPTPRARRRAIRAR